MSRHYEITEQAQEDLRKIEDYLLEFWSYDILIAFLEKFKESVQILRNEKVLFQKYEDTEFHKYLVTKHNTIIYKIVDDKLEIHRIIQNFQDPDENLEDISQL